MDNKRGTIYLLVASVCFGMYGVYSRMIGDVFEPFTQNWTKNFIVLVLLSIFLVFNRSKLKQIQKQGAGWLFIWAITSSLIMVPLFVAYNNLSLGTTYFLFYSTLIIFGIIGGGMILKEKLNATKIFSIIFALVGLGFVYSVEFSDDKLQYILLSLLAGAMMGFLNSFYKKVVDQYSQAQLIWMDALFSSLINLVVAIAISEGIPSFQHSTSWGWLGLYAITQIGAIAFFILGMKKLEVQIATLIMPVEVVFATIFGFLFFAETLSWMALLGGGLIGFAAMLPSIRKNATIDLGK